MPVGGGNQTNHTYRVEAVPDGCEMFEVGQEVRMYVTDPPPKSITLNYGRGCDGIELVLVS